MEKYDSITRAQKFLEKLLESQPNLISTCMPSDNVGKNVATFCTGFIETYSEFLMKIEE